jgi:hypothetical protein
VSKRGGEESRGGKEEERNLEEEKRRKKISHIYRGNLSKGARLA